MTEDYFWGVTLDKTKATEVWDPDVKPDANDSSHVFRGEHTLLVKQAVLGPEVPDDEVNVIEVEAMGYKSDIKFPVVVLKGGTGHSQCVLDLLFPDPPVTFKLVKGNGPIHLLGNHSVGTGEGMADEEDDDEIDEEFEEEEEEELEEKNSVDEKKRKIAANSNSKGGKAAKRPKIDNEIN
ncbi:PREDICTED: mitotic apparatus protein p62-like isoform X4 [Diuraphis noxia]|uniref:mitotic apparatus protein p62-like isoform X4 n=1 Tax=Diuraphis noxia TaxID=143948 RepID=UPI0007637583|nr:PREDICTED: mitotic apparatus protein p62-like isoform X4 [Diuraphis noxia]